MNDLEGFIAPFTPSVREIIEQVRHRILESLPDAWECPYPKMNVIRYGTSAKMCDLVFYIAPHVHYVNLGFMQGTTLPDPERLLEGTGKRLRHIKIRSLADIESPHLITLLHSAVALATQGK